MVGLDSPPITQRWTLTRSEEATLPFRRELPGPLVLHQDLLRQLLLHLPRFTIADLARPGVLESELARQGHRLRLLRERAPTPLHVRLAVPDLAATSLAPVEEPLALSIHTHFHYLGSPRPGGVHLGLWSNAEHTRPVALVSLSAFDLEHLRAGLPSDLRSEHVLVLSRLYAFEGCPRNTVSFTIGRVLAWLRTHRPDVRLLLTYLDPNLRFHGTVYRATNWRLLGLEHKRRYLYLDSNYVTDRQMVELHGTADINRLGAILGERIQGSVQPLLPLEIYAHDVCGRRITLEAREFAPWRGPEASP